VCYGNSFAINPIKLIAHRTKIYNILQPLRFELQMYGKNDEIREFVERTWAMIFSNPLSKEEVSLMKEYASGAKLCCSYMGSLRYNPIVTSSVYHLWKGISNTATLPSKDEKESLISDDDYSKLRFTLVISYCHEDMSWLKPFFNNTIQLQNVIIYSKCKNETLTGYSLAPKPKVISLSNVGRCDHSYAHFMHRMNNNDYMKTISVHENNNHIIFFFTASRDISIFQYRSIQDMIRITSQSGFSCAVDHADSSLSYYHDTRVMIKTFSLSEYKEGSVKSKHRNMKKWLQDLEIDHLMPSNYTPVCYCGNFATLASQITKQKSIWIKIEFSLGRGDNIEEGHFAERSWAGLLSYPLTNEQIKLLESIPSNILSWEKWAMKGILKYRYD